MIPETTPRNTQQQQHALVEPDATQTPRSNVHDVVHIGQPFVRWSARRKRDAWFLLVVLLLGIVTIFALSNGTAILKQQASSTQPGTPPPTTTSGTPTPPARVLVRTAQSHLYPFPSSNVGLMQPAVDAQGNVWVGEMYANRFARLASRTGVITTWAPPEAKNGIMSTTLDAQGNAWFVEQGANYIGRFDPARQTFRIFLLHSA